MHRGRPPDAVSPADPASGGTAYWDSNTVLLYPAKF